MAFGPRSETTTVGRFFWHICGLLVIVLVGEIVASEDYHEVYGSPRLINDFLVEHNDVFLNRTLRQASRVACGSHKRRTLRRGSLDRIAGGYRANEAEFPSYVQVSVHSGNVIIGCGGTILSEWLVITAAHCFETKSRMKQIKIMAGSTRFNAGTEYRGKRLCLPSSPGDVINDYAVVILDRPIQFNEFVQPACLPWFDLNSRTQAHVVGFGRISNRPRIDSDTLQVLPVKRYQPCSAFFSGPNAICFIASNPKYSGDACQGDSGGPIYVTVGARQTLVGIVSRGVNSCRKGTSLPSVNMHVYKLVSKINALVKRCWK